MSNITIIYSPTFYTNATIKASSWKKIFFSVLLLLASAQVGILTDNPHSSSALEIYSTNKGLLIPRITLSNDLNSSSPVSSPATGLLVFNSGAYTLQDHVAGLSANGEDAIFALGEASDGNGIIAGGSNVGTLSTIAEGAGGAFTGYHGIFAISTNTNNGTGCIGVGNAGSYYLYDDGSGHQGSGGAFTGKYVGLAAWATQANNNSIAVYGR